MFTFETPNKLVQNTKFTNTEETSVITREVNSDGNLFEVGGKFIFIIFKK